mmetsp:Transcript_8884/g.24603  ORF Transcript_8884/g.24603 Transcript_8884/m.24603 type:complete len:293 (+) Transcript_8884:173-1051(+)
MMTKYPTTILCLMMAWCLSKTTAATAQHDNNNEVVTDPNSKAVDWIQNLNRRILAAQQQPPPFPNNSTILEDRPRRFLQSSDVLPLDVGQVCRGYNTNPDNNLDCRCRRSGQFDVFADCQILDDRCTIDQTICWKQRFTTILDGASAAGRETVPASRMTTCTTRITTEPNQTAFGEVCVEVQPRNGAGVFGETVICGASLNGQLCKACYPCSNLDDGRTHITVDCCNAQTDAKASCTLVEPTTGIVLPVFDIAGTHRDCVKSGAAVIGMMTPWTMTTTAATGMILLVGLLVL